VAPGPLARVSRVSLTSRVHRGGQPDGLTRDADFTGNVPAAISNNPGGSTLRGDSTAAAAGEVATFTALTLNQPGTGYTFRVAASGPTSTVTCSVNGTSSSVLRAASWFWRPVGPASMERSPARRRVAAALPMRKNPAPWLRGETMLVFFNNSMEIVRV
jgi:hypothetical protein